MPAQTHAAAVFARARRLAPVQFCAVLALASCTSLPSLEDAPNNALSVPPSANLEVARSELPPVNTSQPAVPSIQGQAGSEPITLAPTTPSPAPAIDASTGTPVQLPTAKQDSIAVQEQALNTAAKASPEPEALITAEAPETDDLTSLAASEPPMKELAPGAYEGVYSSQEGIEVFSEDGNLCVGRKVGGQGKLKTGMVLPIACSDNQLGEVKITKLLDGSNAQASLKLDDKTSQKIGVTIQD